MPAGELAVQEVTSARLLHDVRPGKARHLAESIVTVDDSAVLHAGIGYDEFLVCEVIEVEIERKRMFVYSSADDHTNKTKLTAANYAIMKTWIYQ